MAEFDQFAAEYREINDRFSGLFGESTSYFVRYKRDYVLRLLGADFSGTLLDYGCGIGLLTTALSESLPHGAVHGFDLSTESIRIARERGSRATFLDSFSDANALPSYDVILLINVLHHVPPSDRRRFFDSLVPRLAPTGRLLVLEHNTLNFFVMRTLRDHPFDRNAQFLHFRETEGLVRASGLTPRRDFIVFFPAFARFLRGLERFLWWLPAGAQYVIIASRK